MKGGSIEDAQELNLFLDKKIDPNDFFSKTYVTKNMTLLFRKAFARFIGQSDGSGLIVLKQSMGGGKTHNMIALGLLAQYPSMRKQILGADFPYLYEGKIEIVGFTGRNTTELPWIEIARRLNRLNLLVPSVREGLEPPSDSDWRELLGGGPLLLLLDELPFYFETAETIPKGDSTKAVFVSSGLANLFNALNYPDLSRVVVVISDLEAKYERGSEYVINKTALSLKDEAERTAEILKPIDISSPEIYEILRKKLFEQYPAIPQADPNVNAIADAYFDFLSSLEKSGLIADAADKIKLRFKECYPFHPGIVELIANFRNNLKFQQTRGLLRLFRRYVRYLYLNRDKLPHKYFITVSDYDLSQENGNDMRDLLVSINPDLDNAINRDVHSLSGGSAAQQIDKKHNTSLASKFAKAILFASLPSTDTEAIGLTEEEIYAYTLEPNDDVNKAKSVFEEYWRRTSYSKENQRGKKYFGYNENVIAQMVRYRETITDSTAEDTLQRTLMTYFEPRDKDCYQAVYQNIVALPKDLSSLLPKREEITLVISKPVNAAGELNPLLVEWWTELEHNKNRLLFLTGSNRYYKELIESMKDYLAWDEVMNALNGIGVSSIDPEYKRAESELGNSALRVLERIKSTFQKLYYPNNDITKDYLHQIEIDYSTITKKSEAEPVKTRQSRNSVFSAKSVVDQLLGNNRDGEEVIKQSLKNEGKYIEIDINDPKEMAELDEDVQASLLDIATSQRTSITWDEIRQRAADRPKWVWHVPDLLDRYKDWKIRTGKWLEDGYEIILKPQHKAAVTVDSDVEYDFENDEIVLKLNVKNADTVYYNPGTTIDLVTAKNVDNWDEFRLKPGRNDKFTFVAMDSSGANIDGDPYVFTCPIKLRKAEEATDMQGLKHIKVKSLPEADIYYTTDGSSPVTSDTRVLLEGDEIIVDPAQVQLLLIVAQNDKGYSNVLEINTKMGLVINPAKPVKYQPRSNNFVRFSDKVAYYYEIQKLKSSNAKPVKIYLDIRGNQDSKREMTVILSEGEGIDIDLLQNLVENLSTEIIRDSQAQVSGRFETMRFETGKDFLEWLKLQNKKIEDCSGEVEQP
ncbi:DUF499 domain-containing protein [Thermoclostridium stercorarium]|uniref:DUF499 domain-containing protein n=1 Tax=Thermoclostridium stercorarium TaxID=1510 RepID=UPI001FA6AEF6|nr:DUF499 domain-containing protein [Thermoclostridium stercorarium]